MGSLSGEDSRQHSWWTQRGGGLWKEQGRQCDSQQTPRPHIRAQINREEQQGSETDLVTQGSSAGK